MENNGGAGVNVDQGITVGTLAFLTSASAGSLSYTLSSDNASVITMDNTGTGATSAITLAAASSAQTISTAIAIANTDLVITNSAPSNALTLSGTVTGASSRKLTLTAGVLTLSNAGDAIGVLGLTGGTINGAGSIALSTSADLQGGVLSVSLTGAVPVSKSNTGTVLLGAANVLPSTGSLVVSGGSLGLQGYNQSVNSVQADRRHD